MTITSGVRKILLTTHVTLSVGWLGAVASFLVLSIVGMTGHDAQTARAAYPAMNLIAWLIILPLSFASPITGLVLALGTRWGLFRHYWILIKFLITVFSVIVLLIHMQPIGLMADMAKTMSISNLGGQQFQLVIAPGAALLAFLATTTLAVYKPKGMTRYGQRKLNQARRRS